MKKVFLFLLCWFISEMAAAQFSSEAFVETTGRKPVSFNRQPFLLIKITPSAFFQKDRFLMYGVELAPPFGKFSFGFDYGKGNGTGIWRKPSSELWIDKTQTQYRGELRMYFSDWYPFYALDKKPLGRYYALEYVHTELERTDHVQGHFLPRFRTLEREMHLKIGKHFHVTRFFFFDLSAGGGIGLGQTRPTDSPLYTLNAYSFSFKRTKRELGENSIYLNGRVAIKACLVL